MGICMPCVEINDNFILLEPMTNTNSWRLSHHQHLTYAEALSIIPILH